LELKPHFQARALANQHAGGKYKGLANLPKAEHIDVREKIGALANVSGRTVSNVETILQKAAPRIIEALQNGTLSINRALQGCTLPRSKQIDDFTEDQATRVCDKIIREAFARCAKLPTYSSAVLDALRHCEAREPGSVSIRISKRRKTVIFLGKHFQSSQPLLIEMTK